MRIHMCAPLMLLFVSGVSYAQDQQNADLENQNKALDQAEAALKEEFGPGILSINRDFRHPKLVVTVEEPATKEYLKAAPPQGRTPGAPPIPKDVTRAPAPPPATSGFKIAQDKVQKSLDKLPNVKPNIDRGPHGRIVISVTVPLTIPPPHK